MKEQEAYDLILLNIGYAVHHADWNYQNVNSPFARVYFVKEGKAKLHLQEHIQDLTPRHLYIIPPFTAHSYECNDHYTLYYLHIYESPASSRRLLEDYFFPTEIEVNEMDELLVKRLVEINPGRELKIYDPLDYDNSSTLIKNISTYAKTPLDVIFETKGILFQMLSRFLKYAINKYDTTDNRVRKMLRYIRKNINKNIQMDDLIEISYLSKDHLIRLFKKEMGTTPIQYINQKKVEKAQLMLITSDLPIKDIAYNLAFENISYFNRLFKKHTGINPLKYRGYYNYTPS